MLQINSLNLNSYKLDINHLALKYKNTFSKLTIDIAKSPIYLLSLKSRDISLDLKNLADNSIIIFSNCSDLEVLDVSDFSKVKNKGFIFYFYNSTNTTYLTNIKSLKLTLKNKVIVEKSNINFTNLFFNSDDLIYIQENFLLNKSDFSQNDVLLLSKNQKNIINIKNNHLSKKTISNTSIKNVLKDNSFLRYDGLINILRQADFSKAYLETNTMLLSKHAKSINIPMLEIVPKNIVATHAATVEQVTLDELFYLGSRGLSKKDASNLIISSFLKSNISKYTDKMKEYISKQIKDKL